MQEFEERIVAFMFPYQKHHSVYSISRYIYLHMRGSESFRLFDEGPFVRLSQLFPFLAQDFGDFRIVHFRVFLGDFSPLSATPNHEGVHRTPDARRVVNGRLLLGIARRPWRRGRRRKKRLLI